MTLNLLLAPQPLDRKVIIFADPFAPASVSGARASPGGGSVEPLLAGVLSHVEAQRVMFPLPDETTQRHAAPPSLIRGRYTDLWQALSADERSRVLLIAGPTAAYLAPVLGSGASTLVAVRDPKQAMDPAWEAWRRVLGAFPELDEIPEEAGSEDERDRWFDRIRTATSQLELVRATDATGVTTEVALGVGLSPKAASNAATLAAAADAAPEGPRHRDKPPHWLDEALYSLSRTPEPPRARKRRQRGRASAAGDSSQELAMPRKRRRRKLSGR